MPAAEGISVAVACQLWEESGLPAIETRKTITTMF